VTARFRGATPLVLVLCLIAAILPGFAEPTVANAQEHPQEVESLRTKYSATFRNPDGTFTEQVHLDPIHFKNGEGQWERIDTTLRSDGEGSWQNDAGDVTAIFSSNSNDSTLLSIKEDERRIGLSIPGLNAADEPIVKGSNITYPSVLPDIDLSFTVLPDGVEQFFVLNKAPVKARTFKIPLRLTGLDAKKAPSGNIELNGADGRTQFVIPDLWMWDSSPASDHVPVNVTITGPDANPVLSITPDYEWLTDPARVFPVFVDPSITQPDFNDTYVRKFSNNTADTSSHEQASAMKVGTNSAQNSLNARALMHFNLGSAAGTNVTNAKLNLFETYSSSCTASNVSVHRITSDWNATTVNWSYPLNGGGVSFAGTALDTVFDAHGYNSSCPNDWLKSMNVTSAVQGWANGTTTNYGLLVKAPDETNSNQYKEFASRSWDGSAVTTKDPRLDITYNLLPDVPTDVGPTDGDVVNDPNPAMQAYYADPDGNPGTVEFQILDAACSQVKASGQSTSTASGYVAVWEPALSYSLPLGSSYTVRARALDSMSNYSAWSNCEPFQALGSLVPASPLSETVSSNSTPTLSATIGNDLSQSSTVDFSIYEVSSKVSVASGSATGSPGATVSWNVPPGSLTSGKWYYWEATSATTGPTLPQLYYVAPSGPAAGLIEPMDGSLLTGEITLRAEALGFTSVDRVEFFVDGVEVGEQLTAPYSIDWTISSNTGTHTVSARVSGWKDGQSVTADTQAVSVEFGEGEPQLDPLAEPVPEASPGSFDPVFEADIPAVSGLGTWPLQSALSSDVVGYETLAYPTGNGSSSEGCATKSTTRKRISCYALAHAKSYNRKFYRWGTDCTNLASQALRFGGFPWVGRPGSYSFGGVRDDNWKHWWYFRKPNSAGHLGSNEDAVSSSWIRAVDFWYQLSWHAKQREDRGLEHGPIRGRWLDTFSEIEPGDIVFINWDGGSRPDHVMIATHVYYDSQGRKNNVAFSYHTRDTKNIPYYQRDDSKYYLQRRIAKQEQVPVSSVDWNFSTWWVWRPYNLYG
jgi:hypothetical protein